MCVSSECTFKNYITFFKSTLVKNLWLTDISAAAWNRAMCLHHPVFQPLKTPRIDYSPFSHLQSLTQPIPADQIQHNLLSVPPQSIRSPVMIPLQSPFLSKWSGTQAWPSFSTNWFRCQIVSESVMAAVKVSLIVTGIIPKISLSGIEIDVLRRKKKYLVILRTVLISNIRITP